MMIHVKRILLQWYVIKLLYNGASPRSGWKKIYLDIQNGFRLRNAQWLQGLPPFHLRQVLGFPLLRQMRVGRDFHVNGARAQARDEGRDQGTPNQLQLHLGKCCGLRVETVAETW